MRRTMTLIFMGGWFALFLTACSTTPQRFPVDLAYQPAVSSSVKSPMAGEVIIFPLEDLRKDTNLIGRWTHLFGQVVMFETLLPSGERVSQVLVEALKRKGWDAKMGAPGLRPEDIHAGRVVTGKIRTLWAEAVSHFGYTQIDATVDLDIEVLDRQTGVKITVKLKNENAPKVMFFQPNLIQDNLNEIVSGSLSHTELLKQ